MTNPLKFDPAREELIRKRAYHLWESEGRPHGRAVEFWERASELVLMEESGNPGQLPNPIAEGRDPRALEGVEELSLQANLGDFQMTDQGDSPEIPAAKKRKAPAPEKPMPEKPAAKKAAKAAAKPAAAKTPAKPAAKNTSKPAKPAG